MARRRQSNLFEDVMELVSMLPWWAGLLLSLGFYLWLHDLATQPITPSPTDAKQFGSAIGQQLWVMFATYLQYIIPAACVLGASISAFKQHKKSQYDQSSFNNLNNDRSYRPQASAGAPECPVCGSQMVKRTAKKGGRTGETFWGCTKYPGCRGTRATT